MASPPQPQAGNPSMLWGGYLVGCRGHSKQERALSSSGSSSRSFSVQAGAVCIAVEPLAPWGRSGQKEKLRRQLLLLGDSGA